jgi:hypothetical protein
MKKLNQMVEETFGVELGISHIKGCCSFHPKSAASCLTPTEPIPPYTIGGNQTHCNGASCLRLSIKGEKYMELKELRKKPHLSHSSINMPIWNVVFSINSQK